MQRRGDWTADGGRDFHYDHLDSDREGVHYAQTVRDRGRGGGEAGERRSESRGKEEHGGAMDREKPGREWEGKMWGGGSNTFVLDAYSCSLAKFRFMMIKSKYGAVIGWKTRNFVCA